MLRIKQLVLTLAKLQTLDLEPLDLGLQLHPYLVTSLLDLPQGAWAQLLVQALEQDCLEEQQDLGVPQLWDPLALEQVKKKKFEVSVLYSKVICNLFVAERNFINLVRVY